MANRLRGEVALDLGERRFVLRPTFEAVCEIEDEIGTSIFEFGRRLELAQVSLRDLVKFAHACAVQSGHEIAPEHLGELIVETGAHNAISVLVEYCRNYAFGGRPEKKAEAARPNGDRGSPMPTPA